MRTYPFLRVFHRVHDHGLKLKSSEEDVSCGSVNNDNGILSVKFTKGKSFTFAPTIRFIFAARHIDMLFSLGDGSLKLVNWIACGLICLL